MYILWNPNLFADFASKLGVVSLDDSDADLSRLLRIFEMSRIFVRQLILEYFLLKFPRHKVPIFTVIVAARHVYFRPDQQDLPVEYPNTRVVQAALEKYGHAKIAEHALREVLFMTHYRGEHLPTMTNGIGFEEVVLTTVAADFELWAEAVPGTKLLALSKRLDDVCLVGCEAHRPLVELADRHFRIFP